jgi:hypothetical protein
MNQELDRQWYQMEEAGWLGEDNENKFIGDDGKYRKMEE